MFRLVFASACRIAFFHLFEQIDPAGCLATAHQRHGSLTQLGLGFTVKPYPEDPDFRIATKAL